MRKLKISKSFVFILVTIVIILSACNFPTLTRPVDSSFDQAQLMMITSRGVLDLYVPVEGSARNQSQIVLAKYFMGNPAFSTLEDLNQHLALLAHFREKLKEATNAQNQPLIDLYTVKVQYQKAEADRLEAIRADWRRSHRLTSVFRRGIRGFGQFIGQVIDFVGQNAADYVKCQIEGYVSQIQAFLRNPVRYAFDLTLNQKLTIIRNQFLDRLGPFFGQRAYDLLKLDQAAWKQERRIFDRRTKATNTPHPTRTPNKPVENQDNSSVNVTGSWHGAACAEAEGTYQYRWSVDLIQDPQTKELVGTIKFHECPGGGRVLFRVTGENQPGPDYTLTGKLMEGGGDLFNTVQQSLATSDGQVETVIFTFDSKTGEINPNYAP